MYRKKNNRKIAIPSWFLGSNYKFKFNFNRIFTKPPFFSFLLVLFITFFAGFLYYPREQYNKSTSEKKIIFIWIDPSLSATLSRFQSNFNPHEVAQRLSSLNYKILALANEFSFDGGKPVVQYRIEELDSKNKVEVFLNNEIHKPPSPFQQSLDVKKISSLLENNLDFQKSKSSLMVFSDGNENSLLGVYLLKKYFIFGSLVKSAPFYGESVQSEEIVPVSMAKDFGMPIANELSAFVKYSEQKKLIPDYVRPQLFKNSYSFKDEQFILLEHKQEKKNLPLIFVCTNLTPSFIELDPFSSLRELTQFFNSAMVELKCDAKAASSENRSTFRKGAIWVVPLSRLTNFSDVGDVKFWVPQDFRVDIDSLVYIAPSFGEDDFLLKKTLIQMDKNSYPFALNLSPLPPQSEIVYNDPMDKITYSGKFKIFMTSENDVPLAWKSSTLPFYYLRTSLSTVNNELSRSSKWVDFWFQVANKVKNKNSAFDIIELTDVNRLEDEFPFHKSISKILNLNNLQLEKSSKFTLGLYELMNEGKFILFKPKASPHDKTISEAEFSANFKSDLSEEYKHERERSSLLIKIIFLLCVASLFLLWFIQGKDL